MLEKVIDWIDERTHIRNILRENFVEYKVPKGLTFPYVFGVLSLVTMFFQFVSGILLSMYYEPSIHEAFDSVNYLIMKKVNFGWFFRHVHAAGANFFMALIYLHIATAIYYNAYKRPRELTWIVGCIIYLLMITTALTGYILPWGQLSYWGGVVTPEIPGSIPGGIGEIIATWMKGGYRLGDLALGRLFAFHAILLPMLLTVMVIIHLILIRRIGVTDPSGVERKKEEKIPFHPYVSLKELGITMWFLALFTYFVFFKMDKFLPAENFEPADFMKTPSHIAPEWYLLPFFQVFRSIPDKFLGFIAFNLIILLLFLMPFLDFSAVRSARNRPAFFIMYIVLIISFTALTILGTLEPTPLNAKLGLFFTLTLFAFFISLPIISIVECKRMNLEREECKTKKF